MVAELSSLYFFQKQGILDEVIDFKRKVGKCDDTYNIHESAYRFLLIISMMIGYSKI